ncbi:MAG: hypothetical protein IPL61_03715 [Myxococcales bacterium]|nr:hypothetical protein [Myxococcales bacterium]
MPSFDFIRTYFSDVRIRVRRQFAVGALYGLLAIWIALAVVLPLIAVATAPGRVTSVALLAGGGVVALLALVAAIVIGVIYPVRRYAADAAVARWIGARARPLASDLLSTVELHGAAPGPQVRSTALVEALTDATAARLRAVDAATLVDRAPVRRAGAAMITAAVAAGALAIGAHGTLASGWHQLLVAPVRPWNGAQVSSVPLVGDIAITLTPPAYSRRPPLTMTSTSGDFRALAGTTARIVTTVLEPATAVALVIERGAPGTTAAPELVPLVEGPDGLAAELTITGPARYRFQIETPRKQRRIEMGAHAIEIEPDAIPTIALYAPADELDVTNMKRIELAYVAEDDFGVTAVELVWEIAGKVDGKSIAALRDAPGRAQGKLVWDLAEMTLPPGAEVTYHLEVVDNDTIGGPHRGRSRPFRLRVFSPRERHEQNLARQAELAESVVTNLGHRLVATDGEVPRDELHRGLDALAIDAGTLAAAFADDPLADPALRAVVAGLRDRLTKLVGAEERLLDKPDAAGRGRPSRPSAKLGPLDKQIVGELEDDAILLADWLEREQLESMLDIADELDAHQQRLAELLAEYARTGDDKLKAEIARELHTIDQKLAELGRARARVAEDVLDQFVHADAVAEQQVGSCMDEVAALVAAGDAAGAQAALERCRQRASTASQSLESALHQLRGDRMGEAEKKLDELMNELADVAGDQADIAAEADRIFERYADRADSLTRDLGKDARHRLGGTVDKLKDRLAAIPDSGLTPFAREELEIVDKRLADLERMLDDGDVAESLGMAKQAADSLETVASELDAAMADDPSSPFAQATADAIDAVERARPLAQRLVDELEHLTPSPDQMLGDDDKRRLDAPKRRQASNRDRAKALVERAQGADGLPGDAAEAIKDRVREATGPMTQAEKRMGGRDPSGARDAARSAADALAKARREAQRAARQAQAQGTGAVGDEPVRIPGADQYVAPEAFRQELLEGMKRKAPAGYDEALRRYYEDLIR